MSTSRVQIERQGPVAAVVLANPPLNTLDVPLMRELTDAVRALTGAAPADRPRAILLKSGVAGQFSQGIDPKAVLDTDVAGRQQIFLALGGLVEALWLGYVPVVADVSGPALAGGAVLAALADFAVYDAEKGKICFSEVKVGLPLPRFVQRLIRNKVGPAAWSEVMLLGRNVDAAEAQRLGFANGVYKTSAERDELLQSLLGRITRLPPAALSQTLREARKDDRGLLDEFRGDLTAFTDFLTDDYLGKGLRAVVKGESPRF